MKKSNVVEVSPKEKALVDLRHHLDQALASANALKNLERGFATAQLKTIIGSLAYLQKLAN